MLLLPFDELEVLLGFKPEDRAPYESGEPGLYRFSSGDCPHYDRQHRRCGIWNSPDRPSMCREFPFGTYHDSLFREKRLYVSPACAFDSSFSGWPGLQQLCDTHQVELVRLKASE